MASLPMSLADLFSRGKYTTNPKDKNYFKWHQGIPMQHDESLKQASMGVYHPSNGRLYTEPVVVRQSENNMYIDVQDLPKGFNRTTKALRTLRDKHGVKPVAVPIDQLSRIDTGWRLPESVGGGVVDLHPDVPLGRPSDWSAEEQIRNLGRMFRW